MMYNLIVFTSIFVLSFYSNMSNSNHFYGESLISDIFEDRNRSTEVVQVFWLLTWNMMSVSSRSLILQPCFPGPCTEQWPNIVIGYINFCTQTVQNEQVSFNIDFLLSKFPTQEYLVPYFRSRNAYLVQFSIKKAHYTTFVTTIYKYFREQPQIWR